mmetsp:Transcript_15763/g.29845  ORF Transcript_15763/g.29845 Transcript_15763/m.29845 type:complete len:235 (-) Transcript_15763:1036-1740(-)
MIVTPAGVDWLVEQLRDKRPSKPRGIRRKHRRFTQWLLFSLLLLFPLGTTITDTITAAKAWPAYVFVVQSRYRQRNQVRFSCLVVRSQFDVAHEANVLVTPQQRFATVVGILHFFNIVVVSIFFNLRSVIILRRRRRQPKRLHYPADELDQICRSPRHQRPVGSHLILCIHVPILDVTVLVHERFGSFAFHVQLEVLWWSFRESNVPGTPRARPGAAAARQPCPIIVQRGIGEV